MTNAAKYWDTHHQSQNQNQAPSPFLKRMLPRLQKGKVLDIAMGLGHNAIYLAQNGFSVTGFDISKTAIETTQKKALENNVPLELKQTDLDLYLFDLMAYDCLIMTYFKPPVKRTYPELVRTLKQGGTLLIESYTVHEQKESFAEDEAYRDIYFKPNEVLRYLKDLQILYYNEDKIEGHHKVECLARKPLDNDVAKYNLFGMQSSQKNEAIDPNKARLEALFKK